MPLFQISDSINEDVFSQLQHDFSAEIAIFDEFFKKYEERLNKLKAAINAYEDRAGTQFGTYSEFVLALEQKNNEISPLVKQVLKIEEKEELLVRISVFKCKIGNATLENPGDQNYQRAMALAKRDEIQVMLDNLNTDLEQLHDNLLALQGDILEQTKYMKKSSKRRRYVAYERDYVMYRLLRDELLIANKITRSILAVLSESKQFVDSPARYFEKREFGKLHVEEVLPYNLNRDFLYAYESVYCKLFPDPDEREPLENFKRYFAKRLTDYKVKSMTHLLMLKGGPVPVGGAVVDFMGTEQDLCFAVVWFIFVEKEFRAKGLPLLISRISQSLSEDARHFGYARIAGVFGEMENPQKLRILLYEGAKEKISKLRTYFKNLSDEEIKKIIKKFEANKHQKALKFETLKERVELIKQAVAHAQEEVTKLELGIAVDPAVRSRLWRRLKFKKVDLTYVQLPLGGESIDYLDLICLPLIPEWQNGIPSGQMEAVYRKFATYGFMKKDGEPYNPDTHPICRKIIREIMSKPVVRLLDL